MFQRTPTRARLARNVTALSGAASLAGVRRFFRVGERISPILWSRAATALWLKVPPAPPLSRRDRGLPPGEPVDVIVNGRRVSGFAWGDGPPVLLVHGWSGWWQQLSVFVEPLVAAGFRPVAWDAPSHGESERGRFGQGRSGMPDLEDALVAVADAVGDGQVHGIVAHSAGAMASALALTNGLTADRVVLIAPSVSGTDQVNLIADRCGWGPRTKQATLDRVAHQFDVTYPRYEVPDALRAARDAGTALPPALLVHDAEDSEAPVDGSDRLAAAWPGADVHKTTGLGHYKVLWSPETVRETVAFLAAPGPDAPAS